MMVLTSPKRAHKRQNIRKKAKKATIREREGSSSSGDTTQEKAERGEEIKGAAAEENWRGKETVKGKHGEQARREKRQRK